MYRCIASTLQRWLNGSDSTSPAQPGTLGHQSPRVGGVNWLQPCAQGDSASICQPDSVSTMAAWRAYHSSSPESSSMKPSKACSVEIDSRGKGPTNPEW